MDFGDSESFTPGPVESAGALSWPLIERLPARLAEQGGTAEA